jgi:hypothetical protein
MAAEGRPFVHTSGREDSPITSAAAMSSDGFSESRVPHPAIYPDCCYTRQHAGGTPAERRAVGRRLRRAGHLP